MLFSVPQLFEHLLNSSATHPISHEDLKHLLHVEDPEQEAELTIALEALQQAGLIETVAAGNSPQYARRSDESLVVGRLRCNNRGFCFAIRDEPGVDDIYIHGTNLHGAWNGDQVLARITKDGYRRKPQKSPEGEVAAVIERTNPTIVGKLKQTESGFRAVPLDDRLLFEMELQDPESDPADLPQLEAGQFAYIEVMRYPLADQLPKGRIRKVLGGSPDASMDVDLVCCKYDLPQSFSSVVVEAAKALPPKISKTELRKRQDYRDWLTVTLEPLDLQHPHGLEPNLAVSLAETDDGWQLGLHIADVAHWVEANTPLDREAKARSLAVYLDTVVLPLFPPEVHTQVALVAPQDRLTISVLIYLNADGTLQFVEVYPSLIKPRANLSYGYVQALLVSATEQQPDSQEEPTELMLLLKNLHDLSQLLRQQRHRDHGFELQMSDLNPPLTADEDRAGLLLISPTLTAHGMMAEFVIAANRAIGQHLHQLGIPGIYRVQPSPSPEAMQSFLRLASNMDLAIGLEDPERVQISDFQRFCTRIQSPDMIQLGATPALIEQLISTLPAPHHQAGAIETCLEESPDLALETESAETEINHHFGLGLDHPYLTVTSPLHRYADLINQRALHLLFDKGRDRRSTRVRKGVDLHSSTSHGQITWKVLPPKTHEEWEQTVADLIEALNQREQIVRRAERELGGLKKAEYMQKHLGETFPGLIIGVQNYGFFVQIDPIQAEGLVHVSSLKNDWYEYRSRQQALVGRKSRKQFRLGDRVEVQIKNVDYYRQQIDLVVVGEGRIYEEDEN